MADKKNYDLCVIGAGPGGYVAAIKAAHRGMDVALIEKKELGGTCLNIGCIPTKTLIAGAEIFRKVRNSSSFGVDIDGKARVNWSKMLSRKEEVVDKLRNGIKALLNKAKVNVIKGSASFVDRKTVLIESSEGKEELRSDKFIIASGSEPVLPSFLPDSDRILSSTELLEISEIPESMTVLGGGVIGCEFACLFSELGTKVTVVEMLPSILPGMDSEISRTLTKSMKKTGIDILCGKAMENIKAGKNNVSGKVGDREIKADYLLASVGRKACVDGLNLQTLGLELEENGLLKVDSDCKTKVPGIYAIGDVSNHWQLAHSSSAMGITAAEHVCGNDVPYYDELVPSCIFTNPEIGNIGMTSEECSKKGLDVNVGKFFFAGLGKAMAIDETDGFCKIIADKETDQVLGVHIIGPHATDLISEAASGMRIEITAEELGKAIHAHPTLGEIMMETAHDVHNNCIHAPMKKKKKTG